MIRRMLLACAFTALLVSPVSATLLLNEPFDYSDGDLTAVSGGAWGAHSGAGNNPVQVVSGMASLAHGSGSREDVSRGFTAADAGTTVYSAFDVVVDAGSIDVYFAHLMIADSTTFRSRVWVVTDPDGRGDFLLGISNSSTAGNVTNFPLGLSHGTTYRVVHSYDFDTGMANLWVDPASQADPNVGVIAGELLANTPVSAYALRQAGGDVQQRMDNVCVADDFMEALLCIPEPGTLGLLGMGAFVLLRRRRP